MICSRDVNALRTGHVPVLDADPAPVQLALVRGHVSDRVDAGLARMQRRVDGDAAERQLQPGLARHLDARDDACADDDAVDGQLAPVGQPHAQHIVRAHDGFDARARADAHAAPAQTHLEPGADLPAEGPLEHDVLCHDEADVAARERGRGCELRADEAPADDEPVGALAEVGPDLIGIGERAQDVDATCRVGAEVDVPRLGTCREHERAVAQGTPGDLEVCAPGSSAPAVEPVSSTTL